MEPEKISDILQGRDVNSEDTLAILSSRIRSIGNLKEIKERVSDTAFTFQVVANVIGNYKGDGWASIIEEHSELLPYVSAAMREMGITEIADATLDIAKIFPSNIDLSSLSGEEYCELVNFLRGTRIGKYFNLTMPNLIRCSQEERKGLVNQYTKTIELLDEMSSKLWSYDSPDNGGWGIVSRYLEKHLQDSIWR